MRTDRSRLAEVVGVLALAVGVISLGGMRTPTNSPATAERPSGSESGASARAPAAAPHASATGAAQLPATPAPSRATRPTHASSRPSAAVTTEHRTSPTASPPPAPMETAVPAPNHRLNRQPVSAGPMDVTVTTGIAFTGKVPCGVRECSVMLDVFAPVAPGPWPVVVLLRGGPGGLGARSNVAAFARALAARGAVVLNADYRDSAESGGGFPAPFNDVACAIRFARAAAGRWGGDPSQVTLVGHSLGAYVGSVVALSADRYGASCLEASGAGKPDAFLGISGPYDLTEVDVESDLVAVLGGNRVDQATAWFTADPIRLVARAAALPFALVHGTVDATVDVQASRDLAAALRQVHDRVLLRELAGATHVTVVDPTTSDGQAAIGIAIDLALSLDLPR